MSPGRPTLLAPVSAGLLLLLAAPAPWTAARRLGERSPLLDQTEPLVGLLALAGWGLTVWLLLALLVTAGGHLPGRAGRVLMAIARRVAPAVVRRSVEVALGLGVAIGAAGATAASAPVPPSIAAPLDPASAPALPSLDWPSAAPPVVVRPGDSLWRLAERDLLTRNAAPPTDADLAQAWPRWWAANRAAIGDDPHHIHAGTWLSPPGPP